MNERRGRVRLRPWRPRGLGWAAVLLAALALAVLLGGPISDRLQLANPDRSRVSELRAVLGTLPQRPLVLIGMDADLGTYPEIRPALRALLSDLLAQGARIATVSFSPEGRAIAAAEIERLRAGGAPADRLVDFGFVAGAEAGLVLSVTDLPSAPRPENQVGQAVLAAGDGIAAFDMAVLVGGIDFGPRSWVEQVATRLPSLPLVAVAPTFSQPELAPYLRTGQIDALLATVRDEAAYVADVARRRDAPLDDGQSPAAMLLGMLVAVAVVGRALYADGRRSEPMVEPEAEETA
jgi:hypothetical protein